MTDVPLRTSPYHTQITDFTPFPRSTPGAHSERNGSHRHALDVTLQETAYVGGRATQHQEPVKVASPIWEKMRML